MTPGVGAPATVDDVALAAARLLGHLRPHKRTPTADLEAEAEYAERRLIELTARETGDGARRDPRDAAYPERLPSADTLSGGDKNAGRPGSSGLPAGDAADPIADAQMAAYFLGALDGLREELASRRALAQTIRAPARIGPATIEAIRAAVPCQEFVRWGGFVDLQPHPRYAPRYWVGLCPFHQERTPSFTVWPTHFVCFGCGARGDVFRYARLRGNLGSFADAVRAVGAYAGIDPDPRPRLRLPRNA